MSRHTAGPWEFMKHRSNDRSIFGLGRCVAIVQDMSHLESIRHDETEANTSLIMSAPELLAVLESIQWTQTQLWPSDGMYHHVCPYCERSPGEGHKEDCEIGRVIARAKGETA